MLLGWRGAVRYRQIRAGNLQQPGQMGDVKIRFIRWLQYRFVSELSSGSTTDLNEMRRTRLGTRPMI